MRRRVFEACRGQGGGGEEGGVEKAHAVLVHAMWECSTIRQDVCLGLHHQRGTGSALRAWHVPMYIVMLLYTEAFGRGRLCSSARIR